MRVRCSRPIARSNHDRELHRRVAARRRSRCAPGRARRCRIGSSRGSAIAASIGCRRGRRRRRGGALTRRRHVRSSRTKRRRRRIAGRSVARMVGNGAVDAPNVVRSSSAPARCWCCAATASTIRRRAEIGRAAAGALAALAALHDLHRKRAHRGSHDDATVLVRTPSGGQAMTPEQIDRVFGRRPPEDGDRRARRGVSRSRRAGRASPLHQALPRDARRRLRGTGPSANGASSRA